MAGVQGAVDADLGEIVRQDDVAAGVGIAPVALMVILVVRGRHVPAHGQAEIILLIRREVARAADLAFAVAETGADILYEKVLSCRAWRRRHVSWFCRLL